MPEYSFSNVSAVGSISNGEPQITVSYPGEGYYTAGTPVVDVSAIKTELENAKKHKDWYEAKTANVAVAQDGTRYFDMGEKHKYRYVNVNDLAHSGSTSKILSKEEPKVTVDTGEFGGTRSVTVDATTAIKQAHDDGVEEGKRQSTVSQRIATSNWMNNKSATYELKKGTTYTLYAVTSGIDSYATYVKMKTSGSNDWNLLDYQKTYLPEGANSGGAWSIFEKHKCSGDLGATEKSLTTNCVEMTLTPKKDMTVVLATGAYCGYGTAFID